MKGINDSASTQIEIKDTEDKRIINYLNNLKKFISEEKK